MGKMYIIDLSGDMIMAVAVLNVMGFKYFWNIAKVNLVHEYSHKVVNQINEFQYLSLANIGSVWVNLCTPA